MNKKLLITISLIILIVLACLVFNGNFKNIEIPKIMMDSGSKYCISNGGTVQEKQRGDGKEYKICLFNNNRQCEVESLLKGDCPINGLKVTGYITDAATYCVVTGGVYKITGMENNVENGDCTFFNGNVCNVWDLYNGKCEKGIVSSIIYQNNEFNFALNLPRDWENKYQLKQEEGENGIKYISFDYNDANLFKISIVPYSFWANKERKEGEYLGRNNDEIFAFIYSLDPIRSDKQWGEEYLKMTARTESIKNTFKITKPYIFLEKKTESGKNYNIEIMYPSIGAVSNGQVNIEISDFVNGIGDSFKDLVGKPDAWDGDNSLKIFYDPYEINNNFVSIRYEISEYTGGAHPDSYSKSFNYDLKNNKIISLSDIFDSNKDYLNSISNKTIQYLLKVNEDNGLTDEESVKQGAGPELENFKTFTFNKNTIVFYFNPNAVAVYVAGRQDVIFPLSSIKDILRSDTASNYGLSY